MAETLKDKIQNHLGIFVLTILFAYTGAVCGLARFLNISMISGQRLAAIEKAPAVASASNDSLPADLSIDLKDLPSKSKALLMLLTGEMNQEAWSEGDANSPREAAVALKDRAYARDLTEKELGSIAAGSGRKLSYGLRLIGKGVQLHDRMVKVLSDMLGTAEATAWIKERRHEPSPANLSRSSQ